MKHCTVREGYYEDNKEHIQKKQRDARAKDPTADRARYNRWYQRNKASKIKSTSAYSAKKYKEDSNFKLLTLLRSRVWHAVSKSTGIKKCAKTIELTGCSIQELKAHLESQFKEGMSWENQGKNGWEIDHIKPCAKFDLTDPEQQKICFHYTNLQPLWSLENKSKGAKYLQNPLSVRENILKIIREKVAR